MKNKDFGNISLLVSAAASLTAFSTQALAETAPQNASVAFKYMEYSDFQENQDRVTIKAPAIELVLPVTDEWAFSATLVGDTVTGASPQYYDQKLTELDDYRRAYSASLTRYLPNKTYSLAGVYSSESDYVSKSLSAQISLLSDDKNQTWTFGAGVSNDQITGSSIGSKSKRVQDFAVGLTQVLTPFDLLQFTLRHADGQGYFSDQYKLYDNRPSARTINSATVRWNHYFQENDVTLNSSYRYYTDSFGIRSNTAFLSVNKDLANGWSVTPSVRLYTQTAASFYIEPDYNDPFTSGGALSGLPLSTLLAMNESSFSSLDQRLSAFGARSLGLKVEKQLSQNLSVNVKYENYQQRNSWAWDGNSQDLADFGADIYQVGLRYTF